MSLSKKEMLELAENSGAILTGTPDGKEQLGVFFTLSAWDRFTPAVEQKYQAQIAMLSLCAEDRGVIIDGLILERGRSLARKQANGESMSNHRADDCARLIKHFTDTQATAEAWEREVEARARKEYRDELLPLMVTRFLQWKLPKNFSPDAGISFTPEYNKEYMASLGKPPMRHEPAGTNLFDAAQTKGMVAFMLGGISDEQVDDMVGKLRDAFNAAELRNQTK